MGCGGTKQEVNGEIQISRVKQNLNKVDDLLDELEDAIKDYDKLKYEYEEIVILENKCKQELEKYFYLKGNRDVRLEEGIIKDYNNIFMEIAKIEDRLQLNPNKINLNHKK